MNYRVVQTVKWSTRFGRGIPANSLSYRATKYSVLVNLLVFLVPVPVRGDGTFIDFRRTIDKVQLLD